MSKTYEQIEKIALEEYKYRIQRIDNIKQNSFFPTLFLINSYLATYYLSHINLTKLSSVEKIFLEIDTVFFISLIVVAVSIYFLQTNSTYNELITGHSITEAHLSYAREAKSKLVSSSSHIYNDDVEIELMALEHDSQIIETVRMKMINEIMLMSQSISEVTGRNSSINAFGSLSLIAATFFGIHACSTVWRYYL